MKDPQCTCHARDHAPHCSAFEGWLWQNRAEYEDTKHGRHIIVSSCYKRPGESQELRSVDVYVPWAAWATFAHIVETAGPFKRSENFY